MLDIFTNNANPTAASHAEITSRISGAIDKENMWKWEIRRDNIIYSDNIIPSKHSRVDIRWDRYIRTPARASKKAVIRFKLIEVIRYSWV